MQYDDPPRLALPVHEFIWCSLFSYFCAPPIQIPLFTAGFNMTWFVLRVHIQDVNLKTNVPFQRTLMDTLFSSIGRLLCTNPRVIAWSYRDYSANLLQSQKQSSHAYPNNPRIPWSHRFPRHWPMDWVQYTGQDAFFLSLSIPTATLVVDLIGGLTSTLGPRTQNCWHLIHASIPDGIDLPLVLLVGPQET